MDFSTINAPAGGAVPGAVGAAPAAPRCADRAARELRGGRVSVSQIVKLIIPHNTPRSKGICDFIKSYLLND